MKGADLHPKDHSIQLFTDVSNEGWGAHLDKNSTKGLWSDREKRLHINVLELKAVSLALRDFKDQCQNQTVLVAMDNSTVVHINVLELKAVSLALRDFKDQCQNQTVLVATDNSTAYICPLCHRGPRKLLCTSPQESRPVGGIASAYKEKGSRTSPKSNISGVLQQTIFSPKTKQQMETYTGPELSQSIPQGRKIQNGNPGNNTNLTTSRGVGYVHRLQGRLLPHTHSQSVQEILEVSCPGPNLSVQSPTFWSINSPLRVYGRNQRGQTHGTTAEYKNPPVPRRLVGPGQLLPTLPPTHQSPSGFVSKIGMDSEHGKVRTGTQTGVRLCRLPVRSDRGKGQTHLRQVANFDSQDHRVTVQSDLSGPETDVPYWSINSYRKAGPSRPPTHATHSVAYQEQLEGSRINGKSYPKSLHPHLKW